MNWQPIETAPTGKSVLVGGGICWLSSCSSLCEYKSQHSVSIGFLREGDLDWAIGYAVGYDEEWMCNPTHWMPLPDPPMTDNNK